MTQQLKSELMARLYQQRKDAGLVGVRLWVPKKRVAEIKDLVMRTLARKKRVSGRR